MQARPLLLRKPGTIRAFLKARSPALCRVAETAASRRLILEPWCESASIDSADTGHRVVTIHEEVIDHAMPDAGAGDCRL